MGCLPLASPFRACQHPAGWPVGTPDIPEHPPAPSTRICLDEGLRDLVLSGLGGTGGPRYLQPVTASRSSMSLTAWLLSWYSTAWIPAWRAPSTHGLESSRNTICAGPARSRSQARA